MKTRHRITATVGEDELPQDCIVRSVADVTGTAPEKLPLLYDTVDPDAVEQLWQRSTETLAVGFEYAGCEVLLEKPETVTIAVADD